MSKLTELEKAVCYTELVYQRVNKKLGTNLSPAEIRTLVATILTDMTSSIEKRGKNYYVSNLRHQIQLVINSNNTRLITVNAL
ncbi:DUF3781 domain-containing protein [Lactiplantibacillus daoliensis]|uniref:DUF3781 domain-containing protein n=1 Tax=Lactiplantibacillus daoliensis TaxID=2559916 RepID=A0ABW1UDQ5_9LACO|nr:DUF3781 domain-containing protein [Lactiplantibacillus daoliensis]